MIKRIKAPKFKVGKYSLNEYELRNLMLQVSKKEIESGIKVTDIKGNTSIILENGRLSENLYGLDMLTKFTMELFKNNL